MLLKKILFWLIGIILIACQQEKTASIVSLDSLQKQEPIYRALEDKDYAYDSKHDTIYHALLSSEYIGKGLFSFETQKNPIIWLDSLSQQIGKPDSVVDNYGKRYYWHNRNFYEQQSNIICEIREEDKPSRFIVELVLFDKNLQLIDDDLTLQLVEKSIKSLIFDQKLDNKTQNTVLNSPETRFSFQHECSPLNFDSLMFLIANDTNLKQSYWHANQIKCLVNEKGKIQEWTSLNITESQYPHNLLEKLEPYRGLFRFPMIPSKNQQGKFIEYVTTLVLNNNVLREKKLQKVINQLNNGAYKTPRKKDNSSFRMQIEDSVLYNVPFGNKFYSFYLDTEYERIYFFAKKNGKWILKQQLKSFDKMFINIWDINQDNYNDVILDSDHNSNGNQWSDIYVYRAEKDDFVLAAADFCGVNGYLNMERQSNSKYFRTNYAGSWYMPVTTSIYRWEKHKLVLEAIAGTEWLFHSAAQDHEIFFIIRNINNKMQIVKQINLRNKEYKQQAQQIRKALLDEFFK